MVEVTDLLISISSGALLATIIWYKLGGIEARLIAIERKVFS